MTTSTLWCWTTRRRNREDRDNNKVQEDVEDRHINEMDRGYIILSYYLSILDIKSHLMTCS